MPTVVLHIGAYKTGTTSVQAGLAAHATELAEAGVGFPGGGARAQERAVRGLLAHLRGDSAASRAPWDALVAQAVQWTGPVAIISCEFLSTANEDAVRHVMQAFSPHPLRVVLGARDVARVLPAQWQESLQGADGRTWTLSQYADGAMTRSIAQDEAARHFWRRHHWARILQRWSSSESSSSVRLVTVPPAGAPPAELWHRFGDACGVPLLHTLPVPTVRNESLGAESAELVRQLNGVLAGRDAGFSTAELKGVLAQRVLVARRSHETRIAFPPHHHDRAVVLTRRVLRQLRASEVPVVGRLRDLLPAPPEPEASWRDPAHTAPSTMLQTARAAIQALAALPPQQTPPAAAPTLDHALDVLLELLEARRRESAPDSA
jgi:hypothetical protein